MDGREEAKSWLKRCFMFAWVRLAYQSDFDGELDEILAHIIDEAKEESLLEIRKDNPTDNKKHLGVHKSVGPLGISVPTSIRSNNVRVCLYCGTPITKENDSGWEAFTADGVTTQPVCKACDQAQSEAETHIKEEDCQA